jgi:hypothetical protein
MIGWAKPDTYTYDYYTLESNPCQIASMLYSNSQFGAEGQKPSPIFVREWGKVAEQGPPQQEINIQRR